MASDEKRTAVRWLTYHAGIGHAAQPGDVELMPEVQARNMAGLGFVELVEDGDVAPEKRTRRRETR